MSSGGSTAYSTPNPYSGGRGGHQFNRMHSEPISASNFQSKPRGDIQTVYVGNLGTAIDNGQLTSAFEELNLEVRKVNILMNDQGKYKGAGFVTFGTADEA